MELRDLFEILGKYCRLIVLTASIFGLGAFVGSTQLPPKYEAVLTLYVKRTAEPAGENFYTYDGYYNQQAAERYTDTVVGLLESGGILQEALRSAGLSADQKAMRRARKSIEVEKVAPQLVEIKVRRRSREEAQNITDSLRLYSPETKMSKYFTSSEDNIMFGFGSTKNSGSRAADYALNFVGANEDYIEIDNAGLGGIVTSYPFTFSTWFKTSGAGPENYDMALVNIADPSVSNNYYGIFLRNLNF